MNRALAVVEKASLKMERSFVRSTRRVFSFKAAVAALLSTTGIGFLVRRSLEASDAIAKTADSIGISTDALQIYRFAAALAGHMTAPDHIASSSKKPMPNGSHPHRSFGVSLVIHSVCRCENRQSRRGGRGQRSCDSAR